MINTNVCHYGVKGMKWGVRKEYDKKGRQHSKTAVKERTSSKQKEIVTKGKAIGKTLLTSAAAQAAIQLGIPYSAELIYSITGSKKFADAFEEMSPRIKEGMDAVTGYIGVKALQKTAQIVSNKDTVKTKQEEQVAKGKALHDKGQTIGKTLLTSSALATAIWKGTWKAYAALYNASSYDMNRKMDKIDDYHIVLGADIVSMFIAANAIQNASQLAAYERNRKKK